MATCADVGGARYPETFHGEKITPLEGKSLRPILESRLRQGHSEIFWEHEGNRAVVQGRWKLVSRHPDRLELYDVEAGRHAGKVAELSAKYEAWAARANVTPWEQVVKAPRAGGH
jgi:arylsulfatase